MLMQYPCNQQYPFGSSGVVLRTRLCWCCWLVWRRCCPRAPGRGVVAHEQINRRFCSVAIVAVAEHSSFVSVALLLPNNFTACLSAAVAVARFASASTCCIYMSSITASLSCQPLVQCAPYPSDADVCGWTRISRNSHAKNVLFASHVLSDVYLWRHYFMPL